jgi:hypothetical protein
MFPFFIQSVNMVFPGRIPPLRICHLLLRALVAGGKGIDTGSPAVFEVTATLIAWFCAITAASAHIKFRLAVFTAFSEPTLAAFARTTEHAKNAPSARAV